MPLYEYACQQCHRHIEKIQKFSDALLTVCPHCGGALEQTLTAPAIQFKGSGWYKDLYSSAKPAPSGSGTAEGSTAAAAGGDPAPSPGSGGDKAATGSTAAAAPAAPSAPAPATSSSSKADG